MSDAEEITLSGSGELTLAVRAWGAVDAPPLLALHGWLDNAATFDALAPRLDARRVLALDLPVGTRLEYRLLVTEGDHRYDTEDPLNPVEARNPFGHNSVCRSHGYTVPPWARRDPEAAEGHQRSLTVPSTALGRPVHRISAATGRGLDALLEAARALVRDGGAEEPSA